jgi:hypothetical protein
MGLRDLRTKIQRVRRTLLVAEGDGTERLPKTREVLEDGWNRATFDPVSFGALLGSRGYKVRVRNIEQLLMRLPEDGETVFAGVTNAAE